MVKVNELNPGDIFGRWEVISEVYGYRTKKGIRVRKFVCKCFCGIQKDVRLGNLLSGYSKSCGCLQKESIKKHGLVNGRFYRIYHGVQQRCKPLGIYLTKYHGDKGIKCEWKNFIEFKNDMYESYLEHCKEFGEKQTTIDRIDSNGNYCKENCRFATPKEQNRNITSNIWFTYKGKTQILMDWCIELGLNYSKVLGRRNLGWTIGQALELEVTKKEYNENIKRNKRISRERR